MIVLGPFVIPGAPGHHAVAVDVVALVDLVAAIEGLGGKMQPQPVLLFDGVEPKDAGHDDKRHNAKSLIAVQSPFHCHPRVLSCS